jgi:DNA-binding transcriptional regulator YhcF (GntR family)
MVADASSLRGVVAIDPKSSVPPFEQIRFGIVTAASSGKLAVGTRVPPVRTLADDLGLAANTVAKAYRQLEQDGVLETRGRHGSFIKAATDSDRELQDAAAAFASRAHQLGVPSAHALKVVKAALEQS